jgi:hypothetical protein
MDRRSDGGLNPLDRCRQNQIRGSRSLFPEQQSAQRAPVYFSELLIAMNLVLSAAPMPLTAVIMTMLMPHAISEYSIAVAPDSSLRNFEDSFRIQDSR